MKTPFFTIFTPVFNRKEQIHRVWESLNEQTFKHFEWIVVDDGSTDNVWPVLLQYKEKASFPVTLLQQENKGKHFAWNRAVELAKGELFVPADSDDRFFPHTLQFFFEKWNKIPDNERSKYSGINVLCYDSQTGKIVGNKFPKDGMITNNLELKYKYKVIGEKWGCLRTDLLKKYKYPEIQGRGNYIQNYTWYSIANRYNNICYNEPIRIYYTDGKSITNLHKHKSFEKLLDSAPVWFDYLIWHINNNKKWMLRYDKIEYIQSIVNIVRNGLALEHSFFFMLQRVMGITNKTSFTLLYTPAYFYFYFVDKREK